MAISNEVNNDHNDELIRDAEVPLQLRLRSPPGVKTVQPSWGVSAPWTFSHESFLLVLRVDGGEDADVDEVLEAPGGPHRAGVGIQVRGPPDTSYIIGLLILL